MGRVVPSLGQPIPVGTCHRGHEVRAAVPADMDRCVGGFLLCSSAEPDTWYFRILPIPTLQPRSWMACTGCDQRFGVLSPPTPAKESAPAKPDTARTDAPRTGARFTRRTERRRLATLKVVDLRLCENDLVPVSALDAGPTGIGFLVRGSSVPTAERHRACCVRQTVHVRIPVGPRQFQDVAVRLAHVTRNAEGCVLGVALEPDLATPEGLAAVRALAP